jgi:uncharacterized lipoprotein YbaY
MPAKAAQVIVQVEDVSRADAPSIVVSEHRQARVPISQGGRVPFEVHVPAERIDERNSYSVSAHIDVNGSGQIQRGDLITMRTHPVLTHGYPEQVDVEVRPV